MPTSCKNVSSTFTGRLLLRCIHSRRRWPWSKNRFSSSTRPSTSVHPPRVTQVNNLEDAFKELSTKRFDLIIAIPDAEHSQTYEKAKEIKHHYPDIPIVLLTPFAREVSRRLEKEDLSGIDYVFSWLGNTDLLLAIIKLLEDEMNIEEDTKSGVQIIMLVEDSVRFYSSILPHLYKFVLKQSQIFSTEALNEHEQMLRMRGGPK